MSAARRRHRSPGALAAGRLGRRETNALTLSLSPLSVKETASLMEALLDRAALPAEMQSGLLERAGGNPLYAEEFVRLLGERPSGDALPETVQGSSRLASTSRSARRKSFCRTRQFWSQFWSAGSGWTAPRLKKALHRLERREFVLRERRWTVAGENEFAFRHVLVREVAYGQIPRAERGAKHRRVADWIDPFGRPDDLAELLAHHYIAMLDYSEPDVELAGGPTGALGEAGDRALALNAYGAAAGFYRRALDIGGPEKRGLLLFGLGSALAPLADAEAVDRLREASGRRSSRPVTPKRQRKRKPCWRTSPSTPAMPPESTHMPVALSSSSVTGRLLRRRPGRSGKPRASRCSTAAGATQSRPAGKLNGWQTSWVSTRSAPTCSRRLARRVRTSESPAGMQTSSSRSSWPRPRMPPCLSPVRSPTSPGGTPVSTFGARMSSRPRNYETMRRYGHVGQTWWARGQLAGTGYELGRWDEALEHIEAVLAYVKAGTPHYFESGCRLSRAAISFARGDDSTFPEDIDRSLELAARATDPQATAPVAAAVAGLRVWCGDLPGARASLDSALEIALVGTRSDSR